MGIAAAGSIEGIEDQRGGRVGGLRKGRCGIRRDAGTAHGDAHVGTGRFFPSPIDVRGGRVFPSSAAAAVARRRSAPSPTPRQPHQQARPSTASASRVLPVSERAGLLPTAVRACVSVLGSCD